MLPNLVKSDIGFSQVIYIYYVREVKNVISLNSVICLKMLYT